ncbi:uncharacterized protein LOC128672686 [Plodia interpunctella]|uniref:uncharacterized protein LOC128672686 n=1 Tax=Plodia interpunctella TaxID=58824 RepID=UPI002368C135|nr:uncharacterized protein LOC128672686 [Plodia interpunctella]
MYYAYPVPAGGDTINIGYSTAGSSSTTGAPTNGVAASASSGGYNYGTQTSATSTLGGSSSGSDAGYNYNTPTTMSTPGTTAGSVLQTVSTNAPKYLPPLSEGGAGASASTSGGVDLNVPTGGSTTTSISTTTQISSSGVALPNSDYLPPFPNQPPSPGSSPSPGTPPTPTAGYLPPSGSSPVSVPTPAATYLPPVL